MNEVNKTMYIPLCGKAEMSKRHLILDDPKAEEIWAKENFKLKRRSRSKWLMYFMAMRAKVFDEWTAIQLNNHPDATVLHIGAGMDSRALRVGTDAKAWYDVDFGDVIAERKKYYEETANYHMIEGNASEIGLGWLDNIPSSEHAIVIMEGISMYMRNSEIDALFLALDKKYSSINVLIDVYTPFGAKISKVKNPVGDVGVHKVYGVERPELLEASNSLKYLAEHSMTPQYLIDKLSGFDRRFFSMMYTGGLAKKIYKLYEYKK